jgi:Uma2 family endonuclease
MVAVAKPRRVTAEEYLEGERRAQTKSEYFGGVIVSMANASPEHDAITYNLTIEIGARLKDGPCRGFTSDMRVRVSACDRYYYPDSSVVCEEPQYEVHRGIFSLLNPTLIIEVLSDSTEKVDRGEKLDCYRTLTSVTTYILVAQDRPRVEVYTRQADGSWRHDVYKGQDAVLPLPALGFDLRFADIYNRVHFEEDLTIFPGASSSDA